MISSIIEYFNHTWGYVELAGTVASVICVYLAIKQNIWTWFWGAIGVMLFGPMFYHYQLYSDAGLQILFFLPVQALGWWWWKHKGLIFEDEVVVTRLEIEGAVFIAIAIGLFTMINGYYMANYTNASFPYLDAFTTWMSVAAQLLMIRKYVESWILWITMDLFAIGIYFSKGLYVVSGLYVVFLVLATMGLLAWYKEYIKYSKYDEIL